MGSNFQNLFSYRSPTYIGTKVESNKVKNIFGISTSRIGFIGQIIGIFEELLAGKANWYDFGVGIGSIALLVLLGKLKLHRTGSKVVISILISY